MTNKLLCMECDSDKIEPKTIDCTSSNECGQRIDLS
jgi:hypothetical protein